MSQPITTHQIDAKQRLPAQLVDKPFIEYLLRVFTIRTQHVEDVLSAIIFYRFFDTAMVKTLPDMNPQFDLLGQYCGRQRLVGESDALYKAKIGIEMLVLRSHGWPDEIIEIARLFCEVFGTAITQLNVESPPLAFSLAVVNDPVLTGAVALDLKAFLNRARSATVEFLLINANATPFGYVGAPNAHGFAGAPGGGGTYASLV